MVRKMKMLRKINMSYSLVYLPNSMYRNILYEDFLSSNYKLIMYVFTLSKD